MAYPPQRSVRGSTEVSDDRSAGPEAGLPRVFDVYERLGHADPTGAWDTFCRTHNWAAPLAGADPAADPGGAPPAARPAEGGRLLSGAWRLPSAYRRARWLALRSGPADSAPADGRPPEGRALYVVEVGALERTGGIDGDALLIRLRDLYIPAGLTAGTEGRDLRADEAAFLWVAVTGMAMGVARHVLERVADLDQDAVPSGAPTAGLGALLERRRESVRRDLTLVARPGEGVASHGIVRQVEESHHLVRDVYAAAYEYALPRSRAVHPLERIMAGSAPVLQHARFTTSLLPAVGTTSD
ncbi:hypothetical protein [Streptomyces liangshanensis]|uniref:hypothetical protein n=1 Tax=Streptomyces liangshanensis TaxID=2717324 RepID=UPI0036DE3287